MKKRPRRVPSSANGQSMVEFALVLPFLTLLVIGLFDLGWAVYADNMLSNAAREGARTGIIISKTDPDIKTRVKNTAIGLGLTDGQITIQPSPSRTFNQPITVTVMYTLTPLTPLIGQFIPGGGLLLQSRSGMIVEGVTSY